VFLPEKKVMAEPLKNLYNPAFFESITPVLKESLPSMDEREFIYNVFDQEWPDLELKQRVRKITVALKRQLDPEFPKAAKQLREVSKSFVGKGRWIQKFEMAFLPEFVGLFGDDYPRESLDALEDITKLVTGEFAIRNFLLLYPEETIARMEAWSRDKDPNVRRLASEGCRPRLPWAIGVPWLKKHPERLLPILENLRADPSDVVRRSVANNLNDIAKDHPDLVLDIAQRWKNGNPLTNQIIRHGCRTLLKRGNHKSLALQGIDTRRTLDLISMKLSAKEVKRGDELSFAIALRNTERKPVRFRLDYTIDYITASGKTSRRIFFLKEGEAVSGEVVEIRWKKRFTDYTTRKQFPGRHLLRVILNGNEIVAKNFAVTD